MSYYTRNVLCAVVFNLLCQTDPKAWFDLDILGLDSWKTWHNALFFYCGRTSHEHRIQNLKMRWIPYTRTYDVDNDHRWNSPAEVEGQSGRIINRHAVFIPEAFGSKENLFTGDKLSVTLRYMSKAGELCLLTRSTIRVVVLLISWTNRMSWSDLLDVVYRTAPGDTSAEWQFDQRTASANGGRVMWSLQSLAPERKLKRRHVSKNEVHSGGLPTWSAAEGMLAPILFKYAYQGRK